MKVLSFCKVKKIKFVYKTLLKINTFTGIFQEFCQNFENTFFNILSGGF